MSSAEMGSNEAASRVAVTKEYVVDGNSPPEKLLRHFFGDSTEVISSVHMGKQLFIQRRAETVYVNGVPVELHLTNSQKEPKCRFTGINLQQELLMTPRVSLINASVLCCMIENPELYPESWAFWPDDIEKQTLFLFAFGTRLFIHGRVCIPCMYRDEENGKVQLTHEYIKNVWELKNPTLVLRRNG